MRYLYSSKAFLLPTTVLRRRQKMISLPYLRVWIHLFIFSASISLPSAVIWENGKYCTCEFSTLTQTLVIKCMRSLSRHEVSKCVRKYVGAVRLIFTDSFLKEIPGDIGKLEHLNYLDLSRNQLQTLDLDPLGEVCSKLETLIFNSNQIHVLSNGSMDCLKSLVTFAITNNSLATIENGTFNDNLKMLEKIYIMHNSLNVLDSSMVYLPKLLTRANVIVNATWNKVSRVTNFRNVSITDIYPSYSFGIVMTHNMVTGVNIDYYLKMFYVTQPSLLYRLWNCGFDLRFNPFICDCAMEPLAEILREFRPMDPDNPVFSITCATPTALSGTAIYAVNLTQFNCSISDKCPRGCSCVETVKLQLITVHCDDSYMSSTLPDEVPGLKDIHINIKSGTLTKLSARHYLKNTTALDVSGCAVDTISTDILQQISHIETVHLHDNALSKMTREIEQVKFTGLKTLTLHGNPFSCDCHSLWFKKWLIINRHHIPDIDRVLCSDGPGKGHSIIDVKDSDFKCLYPITTKELLIIVSSVVFLLIVLFIILYRNRTFLQVLLIAHCNISCFRRKAFGKYPFDVFISHSSKDDDWVIETLIKRLESQTPPYKVFFDERDFLPGKTIVENVIRAIHSSRTTLLVLTNNFLRSDWCMMEFKQAYLKLLKDDDINFIVIVKEELDETLIGQELKEYLKTNVYIRYGDKYFWPKLLRVLPLAHIQNRSDDMSERRPLLVD